MISFFHFTDDKLVHTIWQLSYESCYPSASSTENNVMLSIPRTLFQYCFCLFFQKQTRASLSALSVIVARATVFSLKEIVILFFFFLISKKNTLFSSKYVGKYIVCGLKKKLINDGIFVTVKILGLIMWVFSYPLIFWILYPHGSAGPNILYYSHCFCIFLLYVLD